MPASTLSSEAKITIHSAKEVYEHFSDLSTNLHLPETEHTWQKIEQSLLHIQAITRGGATKFPDFIPLLKENASPINDALLSERTKLSGTAGDLLNSIAPRLGDKFEPLVAVFVPTLLLICARTNKVAVKRAEKSLHFVVKHCRPTSVIAYLKEAIKDKGQGLRAVAARTLLLVLEVTEKEKLGRRVGDVEACVKSGATDSNPEVRKLAKRLFELYVEIWPERVEVFTKPLTPTIRRYLALPKTGGLVVDIPPPSTAPRRAAKDSVPAQQSTQYEEAPMPSSHAQPSRSAQPYSFFPDVQKSTSSSISCSRAGPGFSMNDATYVKRGLFADQISAARSARLAHMPSFNFDDMAKSSSDNAAPAAMKRQPCFEQLRGHGQTSSGAPTFRVHRFDIGVQGEESRPRSIHGHKAAVRGDINAHTPSFASASGRNGKTALLAAYKQAFVGDAGRAKHSSSSLGERRHRDRSEKSSKHGDKRREKTVAVRFDSETEVKDTSDKEKASDHLHRSKSAPQIAIQSNTATDSLAAEEASFKPSHSDLAESKRRVEEWQDVQDDRPATPPERILHAQTPRTGVKASRVPAQRVVMQSAVKVPAARVAAPTPSAKVAASRVTNDSASLESSPEPKARVAPRTPKAQPAKVDVAILTPSEEAKEHVKEDEKAVKEATEAEAAKAKENNNAKATASKKPTTATLTAQTSKQPVKPTTAKVAPVKAAPSAAIAAKMRLEAKAATKAITKPAARAASSSAASTGSKKVVVKPAGTVSKPAITRKPLTASTAASRAAQKPAISSTSSNRTAKPAAIVKPATSAANSAAVAQAKLAASVKSATSSSALSTTAVTKKPETSLTSLTSRLTAPTASTRNKIVPSATVKKFQRKPSSLLSSSLASKPKPKSSIAALLNAKSKLLGAQSGALDKAKAVRRASIRMTARIEKHRRASVTGAPPVHTTAVDMPAMNAEETGVDGTVEPVVEAQALPDVAVEMSPMEASEIAEEKCDEEAPKEEEAVALNEETISEEVDATGPSRTEGPTIAQCDTSMRNDESQVSEAQEESANKVTSSNDKVEEEQETEASVPVNETPNDVATPVKAPLTREATPARIRTPLSAKDVNLPKATSIGSMTAEKVSSPLLSGQGSRSPFVSSPLRRSATTNSTLLAQFETEYSFEESESESDMDFESDEVVQLNFGPRPTVSRSPMAKTHQVITAAKKQLLLGLDSSSDASLVEANASDETVLLESAVK
ncbi:uncharacterized protein UHOD_03719 [Ustilago sp. UG-2017b]|nr:uncharacterized protein UHOD_03719 [Ustilago sp. UG-2017b]